MVEEHTSTAIATLNPLNDQSLIALSEQAQELLKYAERLVIKEVKDLTFITNDLALIARLKKTMEGRRKDYLQPFQDHIKETNEAYKKLMSPVESADKITRDKILAFTAEQEWKRREQEEINRLRIEAAQRDAALHNGEISEPVNLVEVLPITPERTLTDLGSAGIMKVRKWEVQDLSKVPLDYLMIDATKVGKVVRAGIPSIPGIRIWQEDSLRVTTKIEEVNSKYGSD